MTKPLIIQMDGHIGGTLFHLVIIK